MDAIRSYEMYILTRATRRHISEDGILQTAVKSHNNSDTTSSSSNGEELADEMIRNRVEQVYK
jgi:hypothetical protein